MFTLFNLHWDDNLIYHQLHQPNIKSTATGGRLGVVKSPPNSIFIDSPIKFKCKLITNVELMLTFLI
ncbi:hypothetical protein C2869_22150 (plasmid) [Saccharobesus litoralis]|uniref:Uncharacterized protein n=1 Tax=Saccharobesus litoralis TaxID=2172099 RepID=A0A2S0VYA6_9ALTE|nr:hypothetical protein C2869_22150 [Saccharobesus litoralis]